MNIWREKSLVIDGYEITVNYQKTDRGKNAMETFQIYCNRHPFLPFNVVVKLAKRFLGSDYLHLAEIFKKGRKVYIWITFVNKKGQSIPSPYELKGEECEFEGIEYLYLKSDQIDLN